MHPLYETIDRMNQEQQERGGWRGSPRGRRSPPPRQRRRYRRRRAPWIFQPWGTQTWLRDDLPPADPPQPAPAAGDDSPPDASPAPVGPAADGPPAATPAAGAPAPADAPAPAGAPASADADQGEPPTDEEFRDRFGRRDLLKLVTTADGRRVRISRSLVVRLASRPLSAGWLRAAPGESEFAAIAASLARLLRSARVVPGPGACPGCAHGCAHDCAKGPTFLARAAGADYHLLTRERTGMSPELVGLRRVSEAGQELEMAPPHLSIQSWRWVRIRQVPPADLPPGGGVYIVLYRTQPIYVGETASFARRWRGRYAGLQHMGLLPPGSGPLPPALQRTVWFGSVADATNLLAARKLIKRALIRALVSAGARLTNLPGPPLPAGLTVGRLLPPSLARRG
jgi:hypothetical protein